MDSRSDRADRMFELEEENKRLKAINKRIEQKHHKYASVPARQSICTPVHCTPLTHLRCHTHTALW